MEQRIEAGLDPFGRDYLYQPTVVPIDSSYPDYVQNNKEKFVRFIK